MKSKVGQAGIGASGITEILVAGFTKKGVAKITGMGVAWIGKTGVAWIGKNDYWFVTVLPRHLKTSYASRPSKEFGTTVSLSLN